MTIDLIRIPLGSPGLVLVVSEDIAAVIDQGVGLDSAAGITAEQAEALIADARRWILLGPVEAMAWFGPALSRARSVRPMLLAAE